MAAHNELGEWGEEVAVRYLEQKGYVILERDWKSGHRDIDIIALTQDAQTLVFIEVKTRSSNELTTPEQAIDANKIRNLGIAANSYLKRNDVNADIRFDVITIVKKRGTEPIIEHIEDAFNPMLVY
jgi:putative endonuclease